MGLANVAATLHAHLCDHAAHGYTQGAGRWGSSGYCTVTVEGRDYRLRSGDRDCSSSIIDCWRRALEGTGYEGALDGATYTGDMRRVFVASGLFDWKPMSFIAQRGDIYLHEQDHTAMCQTPSPDRLSEFWLNEKGTITGGKVGDQGSEARTRAYYDYPWQGILHYNGKADDWSDMATKSEIQEAVWGHKVGGKRADAVLGIIDSTKDPSGRGVKMNTHDHVKYIAGKLSDVQDELKEVHAKLDRLLGV